MATVMTKGVTQSEGLTPKLIKTDLAQYVAGVWSGKNESGWDPLGDSVLVLLDQVERAGELGLIELPEEVKYRQNMAAETGIIAALGEGAFVWSADRRRPFGGRRPEPGDRVFMERYSGQVVHGADKKMYRLVTDKCIGAIKERNDG